MFANWNQRMKGVVIAMVMLVGAWAFPSGAEEVTAGPVSSCEAKDVPAVSLGWVGLGARDLDPVHANIPLDEIQDGQFCQAYAVMHVGSPPYYFEWQGQFDDSDAGPGPLGNKRIANGYIDSGRGTYLRVDAWTNSSKTVHLGFGEATLQIDAQYDYNPWCEA